MPIVMLGWHLCKEFAVFWGCTHEYGTVRIGDGCNGHVEVHVSYAVRLRHDERAQHDRRQLRVDGALKITHVHHFHAPVAATTTPELPGSTRSGSIALRNITPVRKTTILDTV